MQNKTIFLISGLILMFLGYAHAVYAFTDGPFFYSQLIGDTPDVFQFKDKIDNSPYSNPRFLTVHTGPEDTSCGDDNRCKARYSRQGEMFFEIKDNQGNKLGTVNLDGVIYLTTDTDQITFKLYPGNMGGIMWGKANVITEPGQEANFVPSGDYIVAMEYINTTSNAFAFFQETGENALVKQFKINIPATIISDHQIIITEPADTIVDLADKDTQNQISIIDWDKMIFNNDFRVVKNQKIVGNDTYENYTVAVGTIELTNATHYWTISGFWKMWKNTTNNKYYVKTYGYVLDHGVREGVVKMNIFGKANTLLYELYHALVELFVDNRLDKSVLTGDTGSYGDYQLSSETPGTGQLVVSKPGFITWQSDEFPMTVADLEKNAELMPDNNVAGSLSGSIKDLSTGQPFTGEISLFVHQTSDGQVIQKRDVSGGNYQFVGLVDYYLSGGQTYYLSSPNCTIYGGKNIKVLAGQETVKNIFVSCE